MAIALCSSVEDALELLGAKIVGERKALGYFTLDEAAGEVSELQEYAEEWLEEKSLIPDGAICSPVSTLELPSGAIGVDLSVCTIDGFTRYSFVVEPNPEYRHKRCHRVDVFVLIPEPR